ncbi:hypothetical protein AAFF_G00025320 [Aldrovandia affinis]|uniref:Uncharacterized protein n=1 Tax=Aldrovandia affinis TaxID=143900 RepID=A0AAD7WGQ6_9TELE|nr:hypothetical protein AAFF_G00025320 [Aldrovandia affinis]
MTDRLNGVKILSVRKPLERCLTGTVVGETQLILASLGERPPHSGWERGAQTAAIRSHREESARQLLDGPLLFSQEHCIELSWGFLTLRPQRWRGGGVCYSGRVWRSPSSLMRLAAAEATPLASVRKGPTWKRRADRKMKPLGKSKKRSYK